MIFNSLFFLLVGYVFLGIDFFNCVSVIVLIINYFVVDISSSNLTTTKKVSIMERLNVLSIRDEKKNDIYKDIQRSSRNRNKSRIFLVL